MRCRSFHFVVSIVEIGEGEGGGGRRRGGEEGCFCQQILRLIPPTMFPFHRALRGAGWKGDGGEENRHHRCYCLSWISRKNFRSQPFSSSHRRPSWLVTCLRVSTTNLRRLRDDYVAVDYLSSLAIVADGVPSLRPSAFAWRSHWSPVFK